MKSSVESKGMALPKLKVPVSCGTPIESRGWQAGFSGKVWQVKVGFRFNRVQDMIQVKEVVFAGGVSHSSASEVDILISVFSKEQVPGAYTVYAQNNEIEADLSFEELCRCLSRIIPEAVAALSKSGSVFLKTTVAVKPGHRLFLLGSSSACQAGGEFLAQHGFEVSFLSLLDVRKDGFVAPAPDFCPHLKAGSLAHLLGPTLAKERIIEFLPAAKGEAPRSETLSAGPATLRLLRHSLASLLHTHGLMATLAKFAQGRTFSIIRFDEALGFPGEELLLTQE